MIINVQSIDDVRQDIANALGDGDPRQASEQEQEAALARVLGDAGVEDSLDGLRVLYEEFGRQFGPFASFVVSGIAIGLTLARNAGE